MEKEIKSKSDSKKIVQRNEKGQLLPGVILNPQGKKAGTLDFRTKWFRFIDKVATQNNITPEEVDEQLLAVAFNQAKNANYQFWKDLHDRVHGKAPESLDITSKGESMVINIIDFKKEQ
jgi:hypothetical protein